MVHHIHAFTIHVTVLILLKGVLYARSSKLIPDKANLGFRFPCDGPGRGGTCQSSAWDHVFLGLFWMYNSISVVIFHFSWKMQSDVWGTVSPEGDVTHITGGNFANSAVSINGWLRDFLWSEASQVIQSYGSSVSAYGLIFLGAHFIWAFSLMFLFSGRGYWQELIESIVWAQNKVKASPAIQPRALSITQGRAVGLTVPHTSDCIFQLKWKITTEIQLYIQNKPRNTWSQEDDWHVPPRPGPSQGKRNPKFALSGINFELRAYKTPFNKIRTVT
jgi:photosystem I P700 chlorophyll a apoprotein A1